jgi:ubiquinone/menaquinone biosynthesis C-methylase UbiE
MTPHRLYHDLAHLWPVLSPPSDYRDEAELILDELRAHFGHADEGLRLLDLGAGGGHLAVHLAEAGHAVTAVDLSAQMLAQCRELVPTATTIQGDMRSLDLLEDAAPDAGFDAVLLTDAVDYMTTPEDAAAAVATVARHLRPGGVGMIAPTYVRETFTPGATESDGLTSPDQPPGDAPSIAPHLFSYVYDLAPHDPASHLTEMLLLILVPDPRTGRVEVIEDRHACGLFADAQWRRWIADAGLTLTRDPDDELEEAGDLDAPAGPWSLYVATRPA